MIKLAKVLYHTRITYMNISGFTWLIFIEIVYIECKCFLCHIFLFVILLILRPMMTWGQWNSRDILHFGSTLQWRHNGGDSVSNHQPHDCLLNRSFTRRSKKTSKLRVTGLCVGNSPGTGEFPAQMASYAENVSIWWRHHELYLKQ